MQILYFFFYDTRVFKVEDDNISVVDKIVKGYTILVGVSSLIAILSDLRFFSQNQILGAISIINILPTAIVLIGAVPIIIYIFAKKIPVIYIIPPSVELIMFIFYVAITFATAGKGLGLTADYIVSNIFNIFLAGTSTYLVIVKKRV